MTTKTVSEIAEICGAEIDGDGRSIVVGPAALDEAGPDQISFLGHPKYRDLLESTRAGAVLVDSNTRCERDDVTLLRCANPSQAFSQVILQFAPATDAPVAGVHPSAVVADSASVGDGASVGPLCHVGPRSRLSTGVVLIGRAWIGADVEVGAGTVVHPGVVIYDGVKIGAGCILHAGAVIGADGFGFEPTPEGWRKVPQCGTVLIEDGVEIGANSAIDRARFGATRIGRGAKLDNLVHVAHNVDVGEGSLLVAQTGISGSSKIGRRAILGGQSGVSGHLKLGDGARVGGATAVFRDVPAGEDFYGVPAKLKRDKMREIVHQAKLPDLFKRVRELEQRLAEMEGRDS